MISKHFIPILWVRITDIAPFRRDGHILADNLGLSSVLPYLPASLQMCRAGAEEGFVPGSKMGTENTEAPMGVRGQ